jgi:hypothetical protein
MKDKYGNVIKTEFEDFTPGRTVTKDQYGNTKLQSQKIMQAIQSGKGSARNVLILIQKIILGIL